MNEIYKGTAGATLPPIQVLFFSILHFWTSLNTYFLTLSLRIWLYLPAFINSHLFYKIQSLKIWVGLKFTNKIVLTTLTSLHGNSTWQLPSAGLTHLKRSLRELITWQLTESLAVLVIFLKIKVFLVQESSCLSQSPPQGVLLFPLLGWLSSIIFCPLYGLSKIFYGLNKCLWSISTSVFSMENKLTEDVHSIWKKMCFYKQYFWSVNTLPTPHI